MIVKNEFREERNDIFSFWNTKKIVNDLDQIETVEELIEETTIVQLEQRITDFNKTIAETTEKIALEQAKIDMINNLQNAE